MGVVMGWIGTLALVVAGGGVLAAESERPSVVFIVIDDLRPMLGCFGDATVRSPCIDAFATTAMRFDRAYCQFALCNPSRASFLSGRRPETLGVFTLARFFRDGNPGIVTLPQHFKDHGYETRSLGKIFHVTNGNHDDALSWSTQPWPARKPSKPLAPGDAGPVDETSDHSDDEPAVVAEGSDDDFADGKIAARAVEALRELRHRPFFLAVGFHKPHLPFIAPKPYWDRYEASALHLPAASEPPAASPAFASNDSAELRRYKGIPQTGSPVDADEARRLIHGYHACVSFVDAQVGRILDELRRLGLSESTVVLLVSDHGYHLAEQGTWTKRTVWEVATRVPLVIRCPGRGTAGGHVGAVVELIDIYPTLVDVCGLPSPPGLEGRSLAPLLDDPTAAWPGVARSVIVKQMPGHAGVLRGSAVRTPRYRWIEWSGGSLPQAVHELYDHETDPAETCNVAETTTGRAVIEMLREQHGP